MDYLSSFTPSMYRLKYWSAPNQFNTQNGAIENIQDPEFYLDFKLDWRSAIDAPEE